MLRVGELEWDAGNLDHLWERHHVLPDEVEDVLLGIDGEEPDYTVRAEADRYIVAGRTGAGRLLFIVGELVGSETFRAISARDMTPRERRSYERGRA